LISVRPPERRVVCDASGEAGLVGYPANGARLEAIPADEAPGAPGGNHVRAAMGGSRPAVYFADMYRAQERGAIGLPTILIGRGSPAAVLRAYLGGLA
jgi:uncharacterized protein (DUF885 family)